MKPIRVFVVASVVVFIGDVNAQMSWQFTNGPYYANIDDFAIGESGGQVTIYAAASPVDVTGNGIVLKSTDRGESWIHRDIPGATGKVTCITAFRSDPNIVYAGVSSQGVFKSTNGGDSWAPTGTILNANISRVALHPTNSNIVWAGCLMSTTPVLYRSINGGAGWVQMNIGAPDLHQLSVSDIALAENAN
jgi:photosystem II stability/assembly factor-like uncharacterized protein